MEFVTCPFTVVFVLPRPLLMKSTVCIRLQFYIPTHIHILMKTLTQSLFSFVHMNTKQRWKPAKAIATVVVLNLLNLLNNRIQFFLPMLFFFLNLKKNKRHNNNTWLLLLILITQWVFSLMMCFQFCSTFRPSLLICTILASFTSVCRK